MEVILSIVCVGLTARVVQLGRRCRHAERQAEWNAALATKAKAAMKSCIVGMHRIGDELEARILRLRS